MNSATLTLVSDEFHSIVLPVICTTEESAALHPYHSGLKESSGKRTESLPHSSLADMFHRTFSDFDNLKITTRSLHGHKHFTAWEWAISCREAKGSDGQKLKKEGGLPQKMIGCTLMWWNDKDKIIKNHEYAHMRDPQDEVH